LRAAAGGAAFVDRGAAHALATARAAGLGRGELDASGAAGAITVRGERERGERVLATDGRAPGSTGGEVRRRSRSAHATATSSPHSSRSNCARASSSRTSARQARNEARARWPGCIPVHGRRIIPASRPNGVARAARPGRHRRCRRHLRRAEVLADHGDAGGIAASGRARPTRGASSTANARGRARGLSLIAWAPRYAGA